MFSRAWFCFVVTLVPCANAMRAGVLTDIDATGRQFKEAHTLERDVGPMRLTEKQNAEFVAELKKFETAYEGKTVEELLSGPLLEWLAPREILQLRLLSAGAQGSRHPALQTEHLRHLLAYFDFAAARGLLSKNKSVALETRFETYGFDTRIYVLLPVYAALFGRQFSNSTLVWRAGPKSVAQYTDPTNPLFGLVAPSSRVLGQSMFVAVADDSLNGKSAGEVAEMFGMSGYSSTTGANSGLILKATKDLHHLARPMLPVLYLRKPTDGPWATTSHFGEGTIPGFTSGRLPEVVARAFLLEGPPRSVAELREKGLMVEII